METLTSMSGTKWDFWIFNYDHGVDYIMKKIGAVETFEDLKILIEENINYDKDLFALFREGIEPRYENPQNHFAFTWPMTRNDDEYLEYFRMFWKKQYFTFPFVNGIYCSPYKISTWTSECDAQGFRDRLTGKGYRTSIKNISAINYEIKLTRRWSISFLKDEKFVLPERKRHMPINTMHERFHPIYHTDILEKIIKVIYDQFHFTETKNGIILSPGNVPEEEWRIPHPHNRFIYSSVKATLEEANKILPKFSLTVAYTLYPRIPTIFLAFAYFIDGNLQLGVYLNGPIRRDLPLEILNESAFDMSCHVAYKMKEVLASILSPLEKIHVHITNSVPSEDTDFTNRVYEFHERGRNINSRI